MSMQTLIDNEEPSAKVRDAARVTVRETSGGKCIGGSYRCPLGWFPPQTSHCGYALEPPPVRPLTQ